MSERAQPRRRRLWPLLAGAGLVLLLLLGAAALLLPRWAAGRVGEALTEAAEARGLALSWEAIEVTLGGQITVAGVRFRGSGAGLLEGEIGRLETRITWGQAWRRERPRRATIRGVRLRADREGLVALRDGGDNDAPSARSLDASSEGVELTIVDLDALVELDGDRLVACHGRDVAVSLAATSRIGGEMNCRSPDLGLETGLFQLDARLTPANAEAPLQIVLEPEAAFRAQVAGARFGRVSASWGPEGGPLAVRELALDGLVVIFGREDGLLVVRRVDAGPGRLRLERQAALGGSAPGSPPGAEPDGASATDGDNGALPLEEAANQAAGGGIDPAVWTAIEAALTDWTEAASRAMTTATETVDRIEIREIEVAADLADAGVVRAHLSELTAIPGRAHLAGDLDGRAVTADVSRHPGEHGLTLALTAESVPLVELSRLLGHEGLLAGHVNAQLSLTANDGLSLQVVLDSPDATFQHDGVGPKPLELLPLHLEAELSFSPEGRDRLTIEGRGRLGDDLSGQIGVQVRADDGATSLEADFTLDEAYCRDILAALPDGLFGHLPRDDVLLAGRAGLDGVLRYTFGDPSSFRLRFGELFPGTCEVVSMPEGYRPEVLLDPAFVHEVPAGFLSEGAEPVRVGPGTESWVPLSELPDYVPAIMYFSEQRLFYDEPAISTRLIERAVRVNLSYGRWIYGGSTITQQLVKNLFLDRVKDLARKLEEAIISWAVFATLTPDQILELYVNCIEFGPDIWGIENASRYYFGISARDLRPEQAVYLAGLKPAPRSGGSHRERGHSPTRQRWRDRIRDRLQQLADAGYITQAYVDAQRPYLVPLPGPAGALTEPPMPFIAPVD